MADGRYLHVPGGQPGITKRLNSGRGHPAEVRTLRGRS